MTVLSVYQSFRYITVWPNTSSSAAFILSSEMIYFSAKAGHSNSYIYTLLQVEEKKVYKILGHMAISIH